MIVALQRLLRWLFMHAEALFNRAFGDRLNPLYHLGAITFFLFWVVGATGLYLYAFFDTSVERRLPFGRVADACASGAPAACCAACTAMRPTRWW